MPCGDCSPTEDECRCGPGEMCGHCFEGRVQPEDVPKILKVLEGAKPEQCSHPDNDPCDRCLPGQPCQHPNKMHTGSMYDGPGGRKSYLYYSCPDCNTKWREEEPRENKPEPTKGDFLRCRCGCFQMNHRSSTGGGCRNCACKSFALGEQEPEPRCEGCGHTDAEGCGCPPKCECGHTRGQHSPALYGTCEARPCSCLRWRLVEPEPPMTPEEEEQAPEDKCCGECGSGAGRPYCGPCSKCDPEDPPPPQPERRPPYLVGYSVAGHLYEVALAGDATVRAVDGALVIKHRLGFVAGITYVAPLSSEGQG